MKGSHIDLSIVVPCFNEEEALPVFFDTVTKTVDEMNVEYEFLFVDDGSSDDTLNVIKTLREKSPRVRYVSFSRNLGKEAAIYAGLQHSRGAHVALMDADLQDPPAYLPRSTRRFKPGNTTMWRPAGATGRASRPYGPFFPRAFTG